jgi:hypothetical protein
LCGGEHVETKKDGSMAGKGKCRAANTRAFRSCVVTVEICVFTARIVAENQERDLTPITLQGQVSPQVQVNLASIEALLMRCFDWAIVL